MSDFLNQAGIAFKAMRQLGPGQAGLYARYRLGLASGWLASRTRRDVSQALHQSPDAFTLHPLLKLPDPHGLHDLLGPSGLASLLAEADEIVTGGAVRIFGGGPVPLDHSRQLSPWLEPILPQRRIIRSGC
jgi:hypothetical protein